jgi:hypothetical protein
LFLERRGVKMSNSFANFLVDVAADPSRLAQFLADPVAGLDGLALTDEERAAVSARDAAAVRRVLAAKDGHHGHTNDVNDVDNGDHNGDTNDVTPRGRRKSGSRGVKKGAGKAARKRATTRRKSKTSRKKSR